MVSPCPQSLGYRKKGEKAFYPLSGEKKSQVLGDDDNITQQKIRVVYFKHWGKTSQYMEGHLQAKLKEEITKMNEASEKAY